MQRYRRIEFVVVAYFSLGLVFVQKIIKKQTLVEA